MLNRLFCGDNLWIIIIAVIVIILLLNDDNDRNDCCLPPCSQPCRPDYKSDCC